MTEQYQVPALIVKIKALLSGMGKAERRVAEYIVNNPETVIYLTVSELAEKSQVSDATVVRTCQKIGSGNYQDLKVSLAQDIVTPLQAINEDITLDDSVEEIMAKVFKSEHQALRYTEETVNTKELERAANTLHHAKKIQVMGLGNSHAIAQDVEHKFLRLGLGRRMLSRQPHADHRGFLPYGKRRAVRHQLFRQFHGRDPGRQTGP